MLDPETSIINDVITHRAQVLVARASESGFQFSGRSRISQTGVRTHSYYFPRIFSENCMKLKKLDRSVGGGGEVPYIVYEEHAIMTDPKIVL